MEQEKQPQQAIPPEELAHLADILKMVNTELEEAQLSVERMDEEYREAQEYIASTHGEGDPKEMFQTQMLMGQTDDRGASAVVYRDRLKKTRSSPYFARIDFAPDDGSEPGSYYIGLYASGSSGSCLSSTGTPPWPACSTTLSWVPPSTDAPRATRRAPSP